MRTKSKDPFAPKALLTSADLNVLSYFVQFASGWADRIDSGLETPDIRHPAKFLELYQKFSDLLDRMYKSTGAQEYFESLSLKERKAIGRKIERAVKSRK